MLVSDRDEWWPSLGRSMRDREELPLARDSLQLCGPAVDELDARAGDEVLGRSGDEHLTGPSLGHDACAGMDRYAADLLPDQLALPGVQPGPHLETEGLDGFRDRAGTPDRTRRPSKTAKKPSPLVSIAAPEARQFAANRCMVIL